MKDIQTLYKEKLTDAAELASRVESGWLIGMDNAISQPRDFINAVCDRAKNGELSGVWVQTMLDSYPYAFYEDDSLNGKVNGISWFSSAGSRKAVNGGWADFVPGYYRDMPGHIRASWDYDAVAISVSPMDSHGYFSLSCTSSYAEALLDKTKRVFLEINRQLPRAVRGTQIHISRVDALYEADYTLPVLPPAKLDETSNVIGGYIAELIPDGACIQLGIGAVNNSKKQIHRYRSVTTFAFGSQRIYDYVNDNPAIEILPVDYVNDPAVICRNDNMISINAALEVDLWGQVCAESIGTKHVSGSGGQVDYVRGACQSKGGKSFIAFPSTAKGGTISKIAPILTPGAIVTTSKNDVDYIVTEFGVAHLRGESLASRAKQLIAIAHPNFRDELTFEARKRGIMV